MYKIIELEVSDELIRGVQKQMGIISDGVFGPVTEHMIKELQFVCDVEVTGKIDQETFDLIFGEDLNKSEELYIISNN
jgi:hypothetical protein|tara:strand:+ start:420 stop:653 length:234 start_codon:yes stop_codon:yes gene_type:complete